MIVADCIAWLSDFAPVELAEAWDNVGLLVGDRSAPVRRVMTCLTLTPDVAQEGLEAGVDLIVTHHPVLFRAVQRLTAETSEGALLLRLMRAGISVYSPHTAFDSARAGINQHLAESLELEEIVPLRPLAPRDDERSFAETARSGTPGGGRWGRLPAPQPLSDVLARCRALFAPSVLAYVGEPSRIVQSIAVACGAGGEFIPDAIRCGCDLLLTGEARFHACLEARTAGLALILLGHYASERPGVERLATELARAFPDAEVWASRVESDPLRWNLP
jgi:dinuclear metal center YbgI/SA1388 family protein